MRYLRHAVLSLLSVAWLTPVYFFIVNAITPSAEYGRRPLWTVPASFGLWDNVVRAWVSGALGQSIASTGEYAAIGAGAAVLLAAFASFAISVLRVRHAFAWFMFLYLGTVFPFQMYVLPLFTTYSQTGLYDTRLGLVVAYTAISIPFAVLLMSNHFSAVSRSFFEAAQVEGAAPWAIFWHIHMPLSTNVLAAAFALEFTWIWNDLLFGLTLSQTPGVRPVMTALAALQGSWTSETVPVILAAALLLSTPTLLVFGALQRIFTQALKLAG